MNGNLFIKNGRVWNSNNNSLENNDILIVNGKISNISKKIDIPKNSNFLDAQNKLIFPGAIDPHVHFNDPGFNDNEDFFHGTMAAAKGGICTIIDMPCTSIPPVTNLKNFTEKLNSIKNKAIVDFSFFGGISNNVFNDFEINMEELSIYVSGFKIYTISGMATFEALNEMQIQKVIKKAAKLKKVVLLHAEDPQYIEDNIKKISINSPYSYYKARDENAEIIAVEKALKAASNYSQYLHIVHVGTGKVVELLKNSNATGETAPHYLQFDCNDFERMGSSLKVNPPVKSPENKKILWDGLNSGTLKFVASDHAPCMKKDKNTGSIVSDYSGIPGCETMVNYLFSEGYKKNNISLQKFVEITSSNAAKKYGFWNKKGSIEIGKDGDFMIFDENETTTIYQEELLSKGKITPFNKMTFHGKITNTIVRGTIVYSEKEGITVDQGYGHFITSEL